MGRGNDTNAYTFIMQGKKRFLDVVCDHVLNKVPASQQAVDLTEFFRLCGTCHHSDKDSFLYIVDDQL